MMKLTDMNQSAQTLFAELIKRSPAQTEFKRKQIHLLAEELGFGTPDYKDLIADCFKVRKGLYNYAQLKDPNAPAPTVMNLAKSAAEDTAKPAKKVKASGRTWKGKDVATGEAVAGHDHSGTNGDGKSSMRYEWRGDRFVIFRDNVQVSEFKPSSSIGSNGKNETAAE